MGKCFCRIWLVVELIANVKNILYRVVTVSVCHGIAIDIYVILVWYSWLKLVNLQRASLQTIRLLVKKQLCLWHKRTSVHAIMLFAYPCSFTANNKDNSPVPRQHITCSNRPRLHGVWDHPPAYLISIYRIDSFVSSWDVHLPISDYNPSPYTWFVLTLKPPFIAINQKFWGGSFFWETPISLVILKTVWHVQVWQLKAEVCQLAPGCEWPPSTPPLVSNCMAPGKRSP